MKISWRRAFTITELSRPQWVLHQSIYSMSSTWLKRIQLRKNYKTKWRGFILLCYVQYDESLILWQIIKLTKSCIHIVAGDHFLKKSRGSRSVNFWWRERSSYLAISYIRINKIHFQSESCYLEWYWPCCCFGRDLSWRQIQSCCFGKAYYLVKIRQNYCYSFDMNLSCKVQYLKREVVANLNYFPVDQKYRHFSLVEVELTDFLLIDQ